jgi:hypothetical protein
MSPEELLEAEVLIYLRGLGFQGAAANAEKTAGEKPSGEKPSGEKPSGPWGKPK